MQFSSFSHHSTGFDVRWGTSFRPNPISIDFEMTHEWRKSSFLSQLVYSPNLTGGCRATPSDLRIGLLVGLLEWQAANSNDLKIKKREEKNKKQHKWYCLLLLLFGVTNGQKLFQMTEKWKNVKNIFRQIWTKTTGVAKMVLNDELTSKWDIPWKDTWVSYSTRVGWYSSFSPHPFFSDASRKRWEWPREVRKYEWWPCPGNPSVSFDIILASFEGHSINFRSFLRTFGMSWVNHSYHLETTNEYRMTPFFIFSSFHRRFLFGILISRSHHSYRHSTEEWWIPSFKLMEWPKKKIK